jgi:hypothetical protein
MKSTYDTEYGSFTHAFALHALVVFTSQPSAPGRSVSQVPLRWPALRRQLVRKAQWNGGPAQQRQLPSPNPTQPNQPSADSGRRNHAGGRGRAEGDEIAECLGAARGPPPPTSTKVAAHACAGARARMPDGVGCGAAVGGTAWDGLATAPPLALRPCPCPGRARDAIGGGPWGAWWPYSTIILWPRRPPTAIHRNSLANGVV